MAIDQDTLVRALLAERAKVLAFIRAVVRGRDMAEDIFQDVCVLALEKREQILDEQHLAAWLRATARLRAMNVLRKRQNRQTSLEDSVLDQLEAEWRTHDSTSGSEMADALGECMERLTDKARQLLQTRYSDGLTVAEIAQRNNRPPGSVSVTLSRIHSSLADCVFQKVRPEGSNRG